MQTSKTKSTTTDVQALAAKASAAVTHANDLLAERKLYLAQAQSSELRILRLWKSGDDESQAIDLLTARAEAEKQQALLSYAERLATKAATEIVNTDDRLAALVAPGIESAYPTVPLNITTVEPTEPPAATPSLVIVQLDPTEVRADHGTHRGSVSVRYHRDALMAVLDAKKLTEHLDAIGVRADVGGDLDRVHSSKTSAGYVDSVRIDVQQAFEELPRITSPGSGNSPDGFGSTLVRVLTNRFTTHGPNGAVFRTVPFSLVEATSDVADGKDSTRRTTVRVELNATCDKGMYVEVDRAMAEALTGAVGTASSGLGRCTSANMTGVLTVKNVYGVDCGRRLRMEAVFLSA